MTLKREIRGFSWALSFMLVALCSSQSVAQTTLFNIPSTDVVPTGKKYVEFDFISHLESHDNGGFQTYVPRLVLGVGTSVEVGFNITFTDALAPNQPIELQPNLKWRFYNDGGKGLAATFGGIAYLPVSNRDGIDSFGLVYANFSKKFTSTYGPRFTVGAYGLLGRGKELGDRGGVILGYEQPLHANVSFVTDWFSGKNRFGYVTPGLAFTLPRNSAFYAGYSIGNEGRKNNALFLYYGITF